jgi:putative ABC transport system permease protein
VFENIAAYSPSAEYTLTGTGSPERLTGAQVTASFLDLLGVAPQLGRNFLRQEDRPTGPKAVLLSDAVWRSNFGADGNVVGRVVALDDTPYTVVGVLPRDFEFLDNSRADVLVPLQLSDTSVGSVNGRVRVLVRPLSVVARLRPGATLAATVTELNAINERVLTSLSLQRLMGEARAQVFLLHDHEIGEVRPALLVLLGAVGFVLLIACANVANLQLARAASREKEVAIRGALGAGRWRLAKLLLTESSALAVAGGAAGLLLAAWAIRLIRRFAPKNIPHLQVAHLNLRVLLFTLVVSLLTGILFGLAPVLAAFRVSLNNTLKEGGAQSGSGSGTRCAQKVLMVAEIALSFVLFIGAALLVKSFYQLTAIRPGFDPHGVLTASVALPLDQYQTPDQQRAFFEQLVAQLRALPRASLRLQRQLRFHCAGTRK